MSDRLLFAFRTALVTGGAGFIGSYLTEQLVTAGIRCVVVDNLQQKSFSNIAHLSDRIHFYEADIRNQAQVQSIFQMERPDVVFHLAAHHFIPYCDTHPTETLETNTIGTQFISATCARYRVRRLFYASTAAVYRSQLAPHEELDAPAPMDIYGMSKYSGELIVEQLSQSSPVIVRVGRFFNAVGPRETNMHVLPEIVKQLSIPGNETVALGNVTAKRDYIHARDLAAGSLCVSLHPNQQPFDVVNIGLGDAVSVRDLVSSIARELGYDIKIQTDPARVRSVDRPIACASITKIQSKYGWAPIMTLDQALLELADSIRQSTRSALRARGSTDLQVA